MKKSKEYAGFSSIYVEYFSDMRWLKRQASKPSVTCVKSPNYLLASLFPGSKLYTRNWVCKVKTQNCGVMVEGLGSWVDGLFDLVSLHFNLLSSRP